MQVFVTGASGHLASAVVPELLRGGHGVTGLARSPAAAGAVAALGATPVHGDLSDLDGLRREAGRADGVVHLAFDHGLMRSGRMDAAVQTELAVIDALRRGLAGSDKPLVGASATLMLAGLGRTCTEDDAIPSTGGRADAESAMLALADHGVRSCVVLDNPTSSAITRTELDWTPTGPGLLADLDGADYLPPVPQRR